MWQRRGRRVFSSEVVTHRALRILSIIARWTTGEVKQEAAWYPDKSYERAVADLRQILGGLQNKYANTWEPLSLEVAFKAIMRLPQRHDQCQPAQVADRRSGSRM